MVVRMLEVSMKALPIEDHSEETPLPIEDDEDSGVVSADKRSASSALCDMPEWFTQILGISISWCRLQAGPFDRPPACRGCQSERHQLEGNSGMHAACFLSLIHI